MLSHQLKANDTLIFYPRARNCIYFLLFSALGVWLFDVFYMQDTAEDTIQKQDPIVRKQSDDNRERLTQNRKLLAHLTLVTLPSVPVASNSAPSEPFRQSDEMLSVMQAASTGVATPVSQSPTPAEKVSMQPTAAEVKGVINQLTDLNSQHIQFLLPATNSAKKRFLAHMYQCENMQFGALTNKKPLQLILLSDDKTQTQEFRASELLRVAHDYLNNYERSLLTLYGKGNRPVRIFPASLDANLAAHIAVALGDKKLQSLSARYFLQGKHLGLTDVVLNEQVIPQNWIISSKECD
jgi:hypothetical protein